jgi:transcriptional regulator with XRE-family HTH domain
VKWCAIQREIILVFGDELDGKRDRKATENSQSDRRYDSGDIRCQRGLEEESASSRISSYEKGVHAPDFTLACKLAAVLDVPEAYFYAVDDDLAELILQYHRFKKNNPGKMVLIGPN